MQTAEMDLWAEEKRNLFTILGMIYDSYKHISLSMGVEPKSNSNV